MSEWGQDSANQCTGLVQGQFPVNVACVIFAVVTINVHVPILPERPGDTLRVSSARVSFFTTGADGWCGPGWAVPAG